MKLMLAKFIRPPPAWKRLVAYLMTYESDTFSASGEGLTQKQAEKMAQKIIDDALNGLDGIAVGGYLDEVRRRR